jgi:hypothetical protein
MTTTLLALSMMWCWALFIMLVSVFVPVVDSSGSIGVDYAMRLTPAQMINAQNTLGSISFALFPVWYVA